MGSLRTTRALKAALLNLGLALAGVLLGGLHRGAGATLIAMTAPVLLLITVFHAARDFDRDRPSEDRLVAVLAVLLSLAPLLVLLSYSWLVTGETFAGAFRRLFDR